MIIVQLKGGLGNQMFQYAAGLSLAAHHQTTLKVDTSLLNQPDADIQTIRLFDLQHLQLQPAIATAAEITNIQPGLLKNLFDKALPPYKRSVYKEADFCFDNNFFNGRDHAYLKGYRQSEKYFLPIEQQIRSGFQFIPSTIQNVKEQGEQLSSSNSISIHIRRGDYHNPIVKDYHGILGEEYYQQAIRYLESKVTNCKFYIFSDDPEWIKANLIFNSPVQIVSGFITRNHFEDFYLISQCKHQVIANSTFSWWAAWLNPNPDKIVIAPKKWFNNAPYDTRDLIPESWIRM